MVIMHTLPLMHLYKEAIIEGDISRIHIDGDAYIMNSPLHLKVLQGALKVVVPKKVR